MAAAWAVESDGLVVDRMEERLKSKNKFYINVIETNYFRMYDPLRVPVSRAITVRELLIKIVDIYGKIY